MATVIRGKRRSAILKPSSLACLSGMPTINLTAGCLHDCAYCYIRGYSRYPGESKIIVYENTLEALRNELARRYKKLQAVYFSPSSDLFQPAPEILEMSHAVLEFLFSEGIGVAFLTKGEIPDETLELLIDHADLVRAQIGLITLDEEIAHVFEPHAASPRTRLWQLHSLVAGGVAAAARLDRRGSAGFVVELAHCHWYLFGYATGDREETVRMGRLGRPLPRLPRRGMGRARA